MKLKDWYSNTAPKDRQKAARRAGTSEAYIWQLAHGYRQASVAKAKALARVTGLSEAVILGLE